jgi:hypothetical protein
VDVRSSGPAGKGEVVHERWSKWARCASIAVAGSAVVLFAVPAVTASAAAPRPYTCMGGSVPSGSYASLTIAGFCQVDSGQVTVVRGVSVNAGAALLAVFSGSNLLVGGNMTVGDHAILALGCLPESFPCFNSSGGSTHHRIAGDLIGSSALMMLIHGNWIGGQAVQTGGGGGRTCRNFPLGPDGPPAYSTWEDNTLRRNVSILGVHTCWMGFIRNTVGQSVYYSDNILADPDGNEIVTNTIGGNLTCYRNAPPPQVGDSEGSPNIVGGRATGQCAGLVAT